MTVKCCVCSLEWIEGEWQDGQGEPEGLVSHTYCPECLDASLRQIHAEMEYYKSKAV